MTLLSTYEVSSFGETIACVTYVRLRKESTRESNPLGKGRNNFMRLVCIIQLLGAFSFTITIFTTTITLLHTLLKISNIFQHVANVA